MKEFDKTIRWLDKIGLPCAIVTKIDSFGKPHWPEVCIQNGNLYLTRKAHLGHVLHEAGHIATTPSEARPLLSGDLGIDCDPFSKMKRSQLKEGELDPRYLYCSDSTAIGWSLLACLEIGIDPFLPFQVGYDRPRLDQARKIIMGFDTQMGAHETCQLFYAGLIETKGSSQFIKHLQD